LCCQADALVAELSQLVQLRVMDDEKKRLSPPQELFDQWDIRCIDLNSSKVTLPHPLLLPLPQSVMGLHVLFIFFSFVFVAGCS